MSKKKKIRRLGSEEESPTKTKVKSVICKTVLWFLIGVAGGLLYLNYEIFTDFTTNYADQYNAIVYGRDYCTKKINANDLTSMLQENILGQDEALKQLNIYIKNHTKFTSIAVIGSPGVGKTLLVNILRKNFPWLENVHHISWMTYSEDHIKNLVLNKFLRRLSPCGHNIILIDDLNSSDKTLIEKLNQKARQAVINSNNKLIIMYFITIKTFNEVDLATYENNLKRFQKLEDIKSIYFRSFNRNDLIACIKRESKILNIDLDDKKISDILKNIEPIHSGCKGIHSKMYTYLNIVQ